MGVFALALFVVGVCIDCGSMVECLIVGLWLVFFDWLFWGWFGWLVEMLVGCAWLVDGSAFVGLLVGCVACAFCVRIFLELSHASQVFVESLILAQDERWRRA